MAKRKRMTKCTLADRINPGDQVALYTQWCIENGVTKVHVYSCTWRSKYSYIHERLSNAGLDLIKI